MEKEKEMAINRMVNEFGWSKQSATIYVNMFSKTNEIEWGKIKNYKKHFVCEICGEETPVECEGSEPNTCAMCMPIGEKESFYGNN